MSRKKYFTADPHFGHANVMKFDGRPWVTIEEHDAALLQNFTDVLKRGDILYVIGDLAWHKDAAEKVIRAIRSHGVELVLIEGNHDKRILQTLKQHNVRVEKTKWVPNKDINGLWLSHYPHMAWPASFHGSGHLFGHVHGRCNGMTLGRSLDMCVTLWDFKPIEEDEIIATLADLPHHDV